VKSSISNSINNGFVVGRKINAEKEMYCNSFHFIDCLLGVKWRKW